MLTEIPLLVLAVAAVLAFLAVVQFWLAVRHDHAVTIQGPLEEERAIAARIAEKRATMADLEHELQKRREALAVVSDIQIEVDALLKKRDELLVEWNQMEDRQNEVLALRREIEEAQNEKLQADGDLASKKADLQEIEDRLARAERLFAQVADLTRERDELLQQIETLAPEAQRLKEAQEAVERLEAIARALETKTAQLEGTLAARQAAITDADAAVRAAQDRAAGAREEVSELQAALAVSRQARDDLEQARATLEARNATLRKENGGLTGQGDPDQDPLGDLKVVPQVVNILRDWPKSAIVDENEALKRVQAHLTAGGLTYPDRTLRAFHTAMKVNESTQMAVLAGISGTGKSQLPRQYAAGMGIGFLQVPVQPRWDSPQDLMGFYNYIEGRYRPTDMARALWSLDEQNNTDALKDRMLLVLLDEMNLARVEYYFSDFLSRLESRPAAADVGDAARRKDAEIELEIPVKGFDIPRLFPGYNLLFTGTMNEDESTQSLSDKVMDRANVLRFAAPRKMEEGAIKETRPSEEALPRRVWEGWCRPRRGGTDIDPAKKLIGDMVELMKDLGHPFGHRLGRAMMAYVERYPETEGVANIVHRALADQIEMRLLPKLRGVDIELKAQEFERLIDFASAMDDDVLAEGIRHSIDAAQATGQFVWLGVTR